ncbi:RNA polymerase sigma factor [Aquimarina sp. MMG015]|uniref:RNA polymerase sigma factor n=1 Tax=unclassified Aquimarina TaxID=2627091 RepID=UPI000E52F949|nr:MULTISPECIES: RNA polymerase sigma factor [unclassified Aquimarina]AXT56620.1 RNA polymerase sigma factor [Aquimarina sp. AD1]MBQ4802630.1 RNA polymerase sigma factor [Aquimarina sp. MMG015]RKN14404.1 sigma-70 family RNA polymerase sigma factor [Aquimarina sp. AD1]
MGKMNTDQAIISGIIKGDQRTLKVFYRDNVRYIQGYILRNDGNMQDVEDVFQDALVVLYQKLKSGTLEINVPLTTYFYGICKNTWRTRLRNKHKVVHDETKFISAEYVTESVIKDIENQEREHLYRKHFQKLSSDNKNLMLLYFEGKSAKEISKITGYTEGYTRKKKFDVKKQLLTMIEKDPLYRELRITA